MQQRRDLAIRTTAFADSVRKILVQIPWTFPLHEDCKQLLRSSGSVGANYREADEAVSPRDFLYRIQICKKEAKESHYWIDLLLPHLSEFRDALLMAANEARELVRIFAAIENKCARYKQ